MDYNTLASNETLEKVSAALKERGFSDVLIVDDKAAALAAVKKLIPTGASVVQGSSVTMEQIGFAEYLNSGNHDWNNVNAKIRSEDDDDQRAELRRLAATSDFYLGSVHALAETGEFIVASNTGSQLPNLIYSSPNVVLVVGAQKIVPTLAEGMKRLEEYVIPLEDQHMQELYNVHTNLSKIFLFKQENRAMSTRGLTMILVKEELGF